MNCHFKLVAVLNFIAYSTTWRSPSNIAEIDGNVSFSWKTAFNLSGGFITIAKFTVHVVSS